MRMGIFGGTFDPVHLAHLVVAEQSREQAQLDQVWFLPSYRPPHKQGQAVAPFEKRVEMLSLAIAGHPTFQIETIEKDRPGLSFTADTLDTLQERNPEAELNLIIGADCLPELATWHDPLRIVERARLLVCARPHFEMWSLEQLAQSLQTKPEKIRFRRIDLPLIELASRDLRKRIQEGKSLKYLVPHAVEVYLREKKLYQ